MIIATDLSGRREPGRIWQNTLDDYRGHFSSFSRPWSVDWAEGTAICALHNAPAKSAINMALAESEATATAV